MTSESANVYLRTKVLTASPEQLRLMLLEGAIRFTRQGRDGLVSKDFESVYQGFSKCRNILVELMTSVRPDLDANLRANVTALYTFLYTQLTEASFEKDLAKTDKVLELLEFERETWVMAMQKAADERRQTSGEIALADQPEVSPVVSGMSSAPEARAPLSVQG